jgi:HSP20 family protein
MALWDFEPFESSPWRELERMRRRMRRMLGELGGPAIGAPFPAVNILSDDDKAVVTAEIPGMKPEDLDVSVENDVLTIRGSREPEELEEGDRYRRRERGRGRFSRSVSLPFAVEAEGVEATYRNGVLRVTLPRSESSKPRKVEVAG